jgi:RecJ-like exonuclease
MTQQLIKAMAVAIDAVRKWPAKKVHIFHHNDADGLSSGAILTRAFERQGFEIQRLCLEKPYPQLLEKVFERNGALNIFTDMAGRIAPLISDLNKGRNLTLILDHHVAHPATDPMVHNLDPDLFGLKGDRDISASTTCYLFARTMDPANVDLAHIAVIGAVGDGFFVDGRLASENREAALEAAHQGMLEITADASGQISLSRWRHWPAIWTYWERPATLKAVLKSEFRSVLKENQRHRIKCWPDFRWSSKRHLIPKFYVSNRAD